jgi:hypothetical protein
METAFTNYRGGGLRELDNDFAISSTYSVLVLLTSFVEPLQ